MGIRGYTHTPEVVAEKRSWFYRLTRFLPIMSIPERTRSYRFWQALTVPALVVFVVLTIDLVLHPLQPESYYNSIAYRLIVGLMAVPLTIAIGLLCMRHSPGNILGPLLIFLATGGAMVMLRSDK